LFLIGQFLKIILLRGPSIVASHQVSVHLAKRFQRGIFKNIDQSEKELPVADMFVNGSRWPLPVILVSDWSIFKNNSALKPLGQMNRNLIGSNQGRSSIKISHF
jgi:hypothetical protein